MGCEENDRYYYNCYLHNYSCVGCYRNNSDLNLGEGREAGLVENKER